MESPPREEITFIDFPATGKRFLAALGQDVEIVVKTGSRQRERDQIRVVKTA